MLSGLQKSISFSLDDKSTFIDSFQFLSPSLESLVKNVDEKDFDNLSQEFDSEVLDLIKQKEFYPCEYMYNFKKFKETLPDRNKFYSSLSTKEVSGREYQHALKV